MGLAADADARSGDQSARRPESGEELVEQRRDGGLAVRARDSDHAQVSRRAAVDARGELPERRCRIVDLHVRNAPIAQEGGDLGARLLAADDGRAAGPHRVGHE